MSVTSFVPVLLFSVMCFLGMCTRGDLYVNVADRMLEYQLDGDTQVVVVVIDGISPKEAKKLAVQRAAEITVANGGRYFVIESEEKSTVIKSEGRQPLYGNMYQELIIENDFNRSELREDSMPTTRLYPAIRFVFTFYPEKPMGKEAIDACKFTDCY